MFAAYSYLGVGTIVTEDYDLVGVKLDYGAVGTDGLDSFGRVIDHIWSDDSDAIDEYLYGHDRSGNRVWKENAVAASLDPEVHLDELYEYDDLYQLIATDRGNLNVAKNGIVAGTEAFEQDWTLDGLGNWSGFEEDTDADGTLDIDQTRDHNAANEIEEIDGSGTNIAHDLAGNMTRVPKLDGSGEHFHIEYDAWNRMVAVLEENGTTLVASYEYDAAGRRIEKVVDDVNTHFFHNGNQVIETREDTGTADPQDMQPKYQNVWSLRYIDSLILRDENTDTNDQCDDGRLFYLSDANYNVTALVGEVEVEPDVFEWQVVERYLYTPYGEAKVLNPDFTAGSSAYANTTLYTGRELDVETGLYYYRARYYNAQLGRFINRDPIGYAAGSMNLYAYVGGQPVNWVDPTGLIPPHAGAWENNLGRSIPDPWTEASARTALKNNIESWNTNESKCYANVQVPGQWAGDFSRAGRDGSGHG